MKIVLRGQFREFDIETEIIAPQEHSIIDIDFNGEYLIQCFYSNGRFEYTGNGIDGCGGGLPVSFYDNNEIIILKS